MFDIHPRPVGGKRPTKQDLEDLALDIHEALNQYPIDRSQVPVLHCGKWVLLRELADRIALHELLDMGMLTPGPWETRPKPKVKHKRLTRYVR